METSNLIEWLPAVVPYTLGPLSFIIAHICYVLRQKGKSETIVKWLLAVSVVLFALAFVSAVYGLYLYFTETFADSLITISDLEILLPGYAAGPLSTIGKWICCSIMRKRDFVKTLCVIRVISDLLFVISFAAAFFGLMCFWFANFEVS